MKARAIVIAIALLLFSGTVIAQVGGVIVELNKLKQVDNACRAYLVSQNLTDTDFETLLLDVVMFDNHGIVAKRLAVDIAPLPAGKTRLKVFDITGLSCKHIGQLLLNDVLRCKGAKGKRDNCLSLIRVRSRNKVPFIN